MPSTPHERTTTKEQLEMERNERHGENRDFGDHEIDADQEESREVKTYADTEPTETPLFVLRYASGMLWLVRAADEAYARAAAGDDSEDRIVGVREPNDEDEIRYLREIGNADNDA